MSTDSDSNALHNKAIQLLARREHSAYELKQKLLRTEPEAEDASLEAIIQSLIERNYLSERRYAEMILRSRISKGYGERRIRQELQERRVPNSDVEEVLGECEQDWYALARDVRARRFGLAPVEHDAKNYSKQQRFLFGRGFDGEQVRYALQAQDDE